MTGIRKTEWPWHRGFVFMTLEFTYVLTYSLTHSLTHLLTYLLTYLLPLPTYLLAHVFYLHTDLRTFSLTFFLDLK